MKAIAIMYDSLNRHMLSSYGCDWTHTPNFARLASKSVTFENSYVCSMPCMPARRDLHTGRPGFLHRSWGPMEPYDNSVFQMLKDAGVYTHIVTDHQHYWEEGAGGNYLTKFNTHEMVRGQEGDPWYPMVNPPEPADNAIHRNARKDSWTIQDVINRQQVKSTTDLPQDKVFSAGVDFIERHAGEDNWFLQIETFDPHEPFFTTDEFKKLDSKYYESCREKLWDWPTYSKVSEDEDVDHMRKAYAALLATCDAQLGRVLDVMDRENMWEDTMLFVLTDHGFCLGEHDSWAKCWLPFYQEIAHTPFFAWDPSVGHAGERRNALVQPAIDLGPTLLEAFGLDRTSEMKGKGLKPVLESDAPIRETAIFGMFGLQVNITDGRYVYMRGPASKENDPLNQYTLMPAHMREAFSVEELQDTRFGRSFDFTKGVKLMEIPSTGSWKFSSEADDRFGTFLFDLENDPLEKSPINDPEVEERLCESIRVHFKDLDAPEEQFKRLGLI